MDRTPLRILCFNVAGHYFSPNDPPDIKGRVVRVAEHILANDKLDVVCVQELYSLSLVGVAYQSERSAFLEALRPRFPHVALAPTSWLGLNSGLLIMSRHAFASAPVSLVFTSQASWVASKGALLVPLQNGLSVCVVHLAWGGQVEASQRSELEAFLTTHASTSPLLVCGDFNGPPLDKCALCALGPTHVEGGVYDHAFARNGATVANGTLHQWNLSDHHALEFDAII